jgi:hypothetical protein
MSLTGSWRECYALGRYVFYIIPRTAWLYYTGRLRLPPRQRHLPIRLRERAWCAVCERVLEAGAVRCPEHPQGEVMILLRDESVT